MASHFMYVLDITLYVCYRDTIHRLEFFIRPYMYIHIYTYIQLYMYTYIMPKIMMMSVYIYSGWVCGIERPLLQISSIIKFSLNILKVI